MKNIQRIWEQGLATVRYGTLGSAAGLAIFGLSATADPVRYVAGDGDDANSGKTESAPVRTLQVAIDSLLATGGTGKIIVGPGIYAPIAVPNAPIIIEARDGPAMTVIDGGKTNRCATLGVEDERIIDGGAAVQPVSTVLSGFTLMNGKADSTTLANARFGGGAVFFGMLTNCVITGNSAEFGGGGASFSSLRDCVISNNTSHGDGGGAVFCSLTGCVVSGNEAALNGGGAVHSILNTCSVIGNKAGNDGGGVAGGFIIANSTVSGNRAWRDGGGASGKAMSAWDSAVRPLVESCEISGNTAGASGGGAMRVMAINCTMSGNTASSGGGLVDALAVQCLITGNNTTGSGGGGVTDSVLISSTVVGNRISGSTNPAAVAGVSGTMSNSSIVWGNMRGTLPSNYGAGSILENTFTFPPFGGNNVSDAAPGFRGDDDYRLTAESPCLDVGNTTFIASLVKTLPDSFNGLIGQNVLKVVATHVEPVDGLLSDVRDVLGITKDIGGKPRVYNAVIDIGIHEFNGVIADRVKLDGLDGVPETEDDLTVISGDETHPATNEFGHVTIPVGGIVVGGANGTAVVIDGTDVPLAIPEGSLITPQGIIVTGGHTVNLDGTITVDAGGAVYAYIPGARPVVVPTPDGGVVVNPKAPSVSVSPDGPVIGIPADVPGSEADLPAPVMTGLVQGADGTFMVTVSNCVALTGVYTLWGTSDLTQEFRKLPNCETKGYALPDGIWTIPLRKEDKGDAFFLKATVELQKSAS